MQTGPWLSQPPLPVLAGAKKQPRGGAGAYRGGTRVFVYRRLPPGQALCGGAPARAGPVGFGGRYVLTPGVFGSRAGSNYRGGPRVVSELRCRRGGGPGPQVRPSSPAADQKNTPSKADSADSGAPFRGGDGPNTMGGIRV